MPYVRCPECGANSYSAAGWSRSAKCPNCGAPLEVTRHGSLETRVRRALYPRSGSVERIAKRGADDDGPDETTGP
jgi:tRNA(Ile2) C34 agmatinyltransferase TiaS